MVPGAGESWSGQAMARAEAVRRSLSARRLVRRAGRARSAMFIGPSVRRGRVDGCGAGCSGAPAVWRHIGGETDDGPRRWGGWQRLRHTRGALRGAGPKGTVRRRDRAGRDDVVGRASGTRWRRARYTTTATSRRPDSSGTRRGSTEQREMTAAARKRRGGRSHRTARHCTTSSDDVFATAPKRIHRGDREGNLQGRRGGAGEATHVERRVRRVRSSGHASRFDRRDDVRTEIG